MSHFPDLSPYTYYLKVRGSYPPRVTTLSIGWLGADQPFPTGKPGWPDQHFLENLALFEQKEYRVNRTCGWHVCELCDGAGQQFLEDWEKCYHEGKLCDDELRVLGSDGIVYAAPSMLGHYIRVHRYRPPEQFIQAVLHGPRPQSLAYQRACLEHEADPPLN